MTALKNSHAVYILFTPHMKFGRMCFVVDMLKMTRLAYMLINLKCKRGWVSAFIKGNSFA